MAEEKDMSAIDDGDEEEFEVYTLVDDESGEEKEFECIGKAELDGQMYYALIPCAEERDEYVILKLVTDKNGDEMLETVDDDDEFEKAASYFDNTLFDEVDYDAE